MCAAGTRPRTILTHSLGSSLEFPDRELGQHQGQLATLECLEQATGRFAELCVLAATQDRGVRVDPRFHARILPDENGLGRRPGWSETGW